MLVSDSETAFLSFAKPLSDKLFLIRYDCFFLVCLFDLIYPIVCLCGVITRSYLSFLIKFLSNTIVCLLPRLPLDIRFRMMDTIFLD